ncbi:hypothetical protein COU62_01695 [Candidatus Pacearchaeota archaeon CG10_big_fil_rev_8_21_14_0_10_35_219]|nr:hypothetical protein [Candidatus Pacearchaeota archaeon]OIO43145.1 MAG: hypothetical protein AUJ63_00970 [Candidatus Pacearchaeota archaeon CG1_02_35_32]PIO08075.1 MAG: hypothetical protein COU62_01695 [Candidatus Pacearchaeota archaeon CG10_big_fil_rev_8_21_14_0_10_35_219]PIY81588.1 MAG: hypothetical protein COY79_02530 [Candidatus Pacearchaeota archaeon CG_4_10_14_0_8_um_filter_35_169]PIZ78963.1 MAG: hypothetical protein COY00_04915 [Candidatus Pacearchaeota archaeon CG_4_10_14_0_2_um_filt
MKKKGAFELSIGTVVVIVIAMALLIMGLVLVRNIFTGATESVDRIDDGIKEEIQGVFSTERDDVIVKLGESRTAKVKANGERFGIVLGARTPDGSAARGRERLQYQLSLEEPTGNNCASLIGTTATKNLFETPLDSYRGFDQYDGANAYALIELNIPEGTASCTQKIYIDVKDTDSGLTEPYVGTFFRIEVLKSGIFG